MQKGKSQVGSTLGVLLSRARAVECGFIQHILAPTFWPLSGLMQEAFPMKISSQIIWEIHICMMAFS